MNSIGVWCIIIGLSLVLISFLYYQTLNAMITKASVDTAYLVRKIRVYEKEIRDLKDTVKLLEMALIKLDMELKG